MNEDYSCCDERRRSLLYREDVDLNGIDQIEVQDNPALRGIGSRTILLIRFFKTLKNTLLFQNGPYGSASGSTAGPKSHFKISGGERIRDISVKTFEILPGDGRFAKIELSRQGDLSTYSIAVVQGPADPENPLAPLKGFDPVFYRMDFRFMPECASSGCGKSKPCPPDKYMEPEIDYLAKDYSSFRRLMLDRMSLLMPLWKERNASDMGVALVELLAYVGDYLSYRQDAVATEAYMGTARKRISVRRHARLVDYLMHEGCNSRVFVQVRVDQDIIGTKKDPALPGHTQLLTALEGQPCRLPKGSLAADKAQAVFETMLPAESLHKNQETMEFYTWGKEECCLPKGATRATIAGNRSELKKGAVLVFLEVLGPKSGEAADADPGKRHAVMLTKDSVLSLDPLGGLLKGSGVEPLAVTEIEWGEADALPFPLCISSILNEEHGQRRLDRVSIALGNIVLADYGRTIRPGPDKALPDNADPLLLQKISDLSLDPDSIECLGTVPHPRLYRYQEVQTSHCSRQGPEQVRPRFSPAMDKGPVTHAAVLDCSSAASMITSRPQDALPDIVLFQDLRNAGNTSSRYRDWKARRDLISSGESDRDFVLEVDDAGTAFIRFGDGTCGTAPEHGSAFYAAYRVGCGTSGNIGADSISHILCDDSRVTGAWNPMPAAGGTEPESIDVVRVRAPMAFRTQERAVTPEDYAEAAQRFPGVQKAVATLRWTGSWTTVFLTVDRKGGLAVDDSFRAEMTRHMERFRMAGHDLEIENPVYVSIDLSLAVCVLPEYISDHVREALLERLGNSALPDGKVGLFHPDNLTFGQTLYLSMVYEAALGVEGVESVQVERFRRKDQPGTDAVIENKLTLDKTEIPRLDNDPSFPDRGTLRLNIYGGR